MQKSNLKEQYETYESPASLVLSVNAGGMLCQQSLNGGGIENWQYDDETIDVG